MFARTHRRSRRSARRFVGPWIGRRLAIEPLEERRLLSADPYLFQQKLVAWGSDQASGLDEFGSSVSVDGNFMVVGAPRRQTAAAPPAAYVFQRNDQGTPSDQSDDTWDPHAVLTASDVAAPDYFGLWSVSISGDTVVVGAPNDDNEGGVDAGAAYAFGATAINVIPQVANLAVTSPINEGQWATLSGEFVESSSLDAPTLRIDWGDGSPAETFTYPAGTTSFSEQHRYVDDDADDTYTISVSAGVRPRIVATSPVLDQGPIPPTSTIDVTFNEPIDLATFDLRDVGLVNLDDLQASLAGQFGGAFYDTEVVGSLLYAATGAGLQILDVSNPGNVTRLGGYVTSSHAALDVQVVGSLAYLVDGSSGLYILDVSSPASVTRVGGYVTSGDAVAVHVLEDVAYVVAWGRGLEILDVSDPANVTRLGGYETPGYPYAWGVQAVGNLAYVAAWDAGLQILDVSDPANVTRVGGYDTPGTAYAVQVVGNLAYVADWDAGLQILDVSDPASVTQVGGYDTSSSAVDVQVVDNLAYVADSTALQILNVSNPASVSELGRYFTGSSAEAVEVVGGLAYVAKWNNIWDVGLQVLDVSNPTSVTQVGRYGALAQLRQLST